MPGLSPFADLVEQIGVPRGSRPQETQDVSTPSLTPVATGTTSVFRTNPAIRFQQAVDAQLAVNDLERRVRRLTRQLTPAPPAQPHSVRRSRWSAW